MQAGSVLRPGAPAASGSERLRPPARSPGTAGTGSSCLCTSITREGSAPFLCYNTCNWDGSNRHEFKSRGFKYMRFKCDGSNCNSSNGNTKPGLPGSLKPCALVFLSLLLHPTAFWHGTHTGPRLPVPSSTWGARSCSRECGGHATSSQHCSQ